MRRITTLLLAVLAIVVAPASTTLAEPPVVDGGMCSLLTPGEIKDVFPKGHWQVADDGETADACYFHNGLFDKAAASLLVKVVPSSTEGADEFFSGLGSDSAEAVALSVGDTDAVFVPFTESGSLYVRPASDWWYTVEGSGRGPGLQEKLAGLGALVLGRLQGADAGAGASPEASPAAASPAVSASPGLGAGASPPTGVGAAATTGPVDVPSSLPSASPVSGPPVDALAGSGCGKRNCYSVHEACDQADLWLIDVSGQVVEAFLTATVPVEGGESELAIETPGSILGSTWTRYLHGTATLEAGDAPLLTIANKDGRVKVPLEASDHCSR